MILAIAGLSIKICDLERSGALTTSTSASTSLYATTRHFDVSVSFQFSWPIPVKL